MGGNDGHIIERLAPSVQRIFCNCRRQTHGCKVMAIDNMTLLVKYTTKQGKHKVQPIMMSNTIISQKLLIAHNIKMEL